MGLIGAVCKFENNISGVILDKYINTDNILNSTYSFYIVLCYDNIIRHIKCNSVIGIITDLKTGKNPTIDGK